MARGDIIRVDSRIGFDKVFGLVDRLEIAGDDDLKLYARNRVQSAIEQAARDDEARAILSRLGEASGPVRRPLGLPLLVMAVILLLLALAAALWLSFGHGPPPAAPAPTGNTLLDRLQQRAAMQRSGNSLATVAWLIAALAGLATGAALALRRRRIEDAAIVQFDMTETDTGALLITRRVVARG